MGNNQAGNWHNVGTAQYHGRERRRRSYGAGIYHLGPNGLTS